MPKHYLKKPKRMRKFKDDDQQPVYILPIAGEVPVYDVRESESFNENVNNKTMSTASYDYPGIVREESSSVITSDSYDYPRQLGSSVPIHILKHRQSSPALSSPANSSTSFPYPSISSSSSDNQLLASAGKPDKLSRIFEESHRIGRDDEEEEYVYEMLITSAKGEQNGDYTYELLDAENYPATAPRDSPKNIVLHNGQRVNEMMDEEYVYETLKSKGKRLPSSQSSIEDEATGEAIYDTCISDKGCSPPPLQSVRGAQLHPSNSQPPDTRQDPSLRITQMPLPSLPVGENNVSKKLAIDVSSKGNPVDAAGYLILKGENQNKEDPYDVVQDDVHRTHESLQGTSLQAL